MARGLHIVVDIEVRFEVGLWNAVVIGQVAEQRAVVEGMRNGGIDFSAVAGREDRSLDHLVPAGESAQRLRQPRLHERKALPKLDGRGAVIEAYDDEMHANALARASSARPSRTSSRIVSSAASRPAALAQRGVPHKFYHVLAGLSQQRRVVLPLRPELFLEKLAQVHRQRRAGAAGGQADQEVTSRTAAMKTKSPSSASPDWQQRTPRFRASRQTAAFTSGSSVAATARNAPSSTPASYARPSILSASPSSCSAETTEGATIRTIAPHSWSDFARRAATVPPPTTTHVRPSRSRAMGRRAAMGLRRDRGRRRFRQFGRLLLREVIREDREFLHERDIAHDHMVRDAQDGRGEVQNGAYAGLDQAVRHMLRRRPRHRQNRDARAEGGVHLVKARNVEDFEVPEGLADLRVVVVEDGNDVELVLAQARITYKRRAEVTRADQQDTLLLVYFEDRAIRDCSSVTLYPTPGLPNSPK